MLKNVDATVKKETGFIAGVVLVCSALMQLVFLLLGAWNMTVVWGNLLGGSFSVLNFFLMGLTIQKALGKTAKDAASQMKVSQSLRLLMMVLVAVAGASLPCFHLIATLIPMLFPRLGVTIRGIQSKKEE